MQTATVPAADASRIEAARDRPILKSRGALTGPVVLGWRDDRTQSIAPAIPGAAVTPGRWDEHGIAIGGKGG